MAKNPFMLIFRESTPEVYAAMTAEQRAGVLTRWNAWYDGLVAAGTVDHGHPLADAVRVVAGARGERVTDGPFAEGKEAIGGYFFLWVDDLAAATAVAQTCPSLQYGMTVEVRAVAEHCHLGKVSAKPPAPAA